MPLTTANRTNRSPRRLGQQSWLPAELQSGRLNQQGENRALTTPSWSGLSSSRSLKFKADFEPWLRTKGLSSWLTSAPSTALTHLIVFQTRDATKLGCLSVSGSLFLHLLTETALVNQHCRKVRKSSQIRPSRQKRPTAESLLNLCTSVHYYYLPPCCWSWFNFYNRMTKQSKVTTGISLTRGNGLMANQWCVNWCVGYFLWLHFKQQKYHYTVDVVQLDGSDIVLWIAKPSLAKSW